MSQIFVLKTSSGELRGTLFTWYPGKESNSHHKVRSLVFYPLKYQDIMASAEGFEPT